MNIGFNPSQITQLIPGLSGSSGAGTSPIAKKVAIKDDFGELLLKKFEAPQEINSPSPDLGSGVGDFIKQVNAHQKAAGEVRNAFLSGESVSLHQTMIASQEASVSFSLMVEMRNKVLEAYQELMRIQI